MRARATRASETRRNPARRRPRLRARRRRPRQHARESMARFAHACVVVVVHPAHASIARVIHRCATSIAREPDGSRSTNDISARFPQSHGGAFLGGSFPLRVGCGHRPIVTRHAHTHWAPPRDRAIDRDRDRDGCRSRWMSIAMDVDRSRSNHRSHPRHVGRASWTARRRVGTFPHARTERRAKFYTSRTVRSARHHHRALCSNLCVITFLVSRAIGR